MKRITPIFFACLICAFLLGACNLPNRSEDGDNPGQAQTIAALTVDARLTLNADGINVQTLPPTNTISMLVTNTPLPSNTPAASNTPGKTPTATTAVPCNRAGFVDDVTIPDGTEIAPGEDFTKTWKLKNTGSCTWNSDYKLVFESGDAMGAPAVVDFPSTTVAPNQTVNVSIDFTAPGTPGNYVSDWMLRSDTGEVFGLGSDADGTFFVDINVLAPLSYKISVNNSHVCGTDIVVVFEVENDGSEFLQSSTGVITNLDTSVSKSLVPSNTPFVENSSSCSSGYVSDADPGDTYYFLVNLGAVVSGDKFQITTSFCTEDGLGGDCLDKTKNYTIP